MTDTSVELVPFMSLQNYKMLRDVATKYLAELGISVELAERAGVRMDRLLYKAMDDSDYDHLTTVQKNRMALEVVVGFVRGVADDANARMQPKAMEVPDAGPLCPDPFKEYRAAMVESEMSTGSAYGAFRPDVLPGAFDSSASAEPPVSPPKRLVKRYVLINGHDRDWETQPNRFSFSVGLGSGDIKSIRSVAATRLILPGEIEEEATMGNVPKTRFEKPFGVRYPYVVLAIDEIQNTYRSSNAVSRGAFAHFVFDRQHSSPNGRGYVHLIPIQNESRSFDINPMSNLDRMTVRVTTPGGELLNSSRDDARVLRMDWNNQVNMNDSLVMVTTVDYFDRNEFFTGDTVRFSGFESGYPLLDDYVNRYNGHDVVEIGTANVDGFTTTFYIQAPGAFNPSTGAFDVNRAITDDLMSYITSLDYAGSPPDKLCVAMNASLQVAVSFEVTVEEDDVRM